MSALREHFGWPGALAVAVFVAAGVLATRTMPSLQQEKATLVQRLARAQAASAGGAEERLDLPLPSVRQRGSDLELISRLMNETGLRFDRADYAVGTAPAAGAIRVDVTLPATGQYSQLRSFLARALQELPHAAIDNLVIEREATASRGLQVTARLALFYNSDRSVKP